MMYLPYEAFIFVMPKMKRQHFLDKTGNVFYDKTVTLRLPGNDRCVFRLLNKSDNTFKMA